MLRALLIDDEPPARADLRERLAAHLEVLVVGEAGTLTRARALLARDDYDLVFLDIQLRGGSGFDLIPYVRAEARVIFVTAFDQHALRAFQVNALDYLLKPVAPERLATSLQRLGHAVASTASFAVSSLTPDDQILLKTDLAPRFVLVGDISAILAEENYTDVVLAGGAHHLVRRTLAAWEAQLPTADFARAHRHALVNVAHIVRATPAGEDGAQLHLAGLGAPISASRRQWPALKLKLAVVRAAAG